MPTSYKKRVRWRNENTVQLHRTEVTEEDTKTAEGDLCMTPTPKETAKGEGSVDNLRGRKAKIEQFLEASVGYGRI